MNDTSPEMLRKLNGLYLSLTPEESFKKMQSMCSTVREIILSQMPAGLSDLEKRKLLFEIYYRQNFSKEEFEKLKWRMFTDGNV
ncbi:MAG TPA: hypothetical protein PK536_06005 [Ignavibacteria bacterium]|nr:hypothetical protein [Bacteroidota bacterium]HRI84985.1 hypothetical protein [Ignavibacteria bacterium]HRK00860.1 hypothetical protein [Ignavibacteria bacterium]